MAGGGAGVAGSRGEVTQKRGAGGGGGEEGREGGGGARQPMENDKEKPGQF